MHHRDDSFAVTIQNISVKQLLRYIWRFGGNCFGYKPLWVLGTRLCEFWVQAFVSFYWLRFCVYLLQTLSVYIDWDSVFIFNTLLRLFQLWFHLFLRDFLCLNWLWVFIIFHSLFVSLLTLLTVFSSQGRQCLFQLSISNRLCVSIQVMILCLYLSDFCISSFIVTC